MSACQVKNCASTIKIWEISNENESPPLYKNFFVCNDHLNLEERLKDIHKALVLGRFNQQRGNDVSYNGWHLKKDTVTWGRNGSAAPKCSACGTTEKIWLNYRLELSEEEDSEENSKSSDDEASILCYMHLRQAGRVFSKDPVIQSWNSTTGILTLEETWTEEANSDDGDQPLKRMKTGSST